MSKKENDTFIEDVQDMWENYKKEHGPIGERSIEEKCKILNIPFE